MTAGSPKPALPRSAMARRGILVGALALGGLATTRWFNTRATLDGAALSVTEAHRAALGGAITLVDIRRPDEWARTGIPEGAIPLDMRDPAFVQKLRAHLTDANAPIALICARGVRSRHLAAKLSEAGFSNVLDVPEGMLGSGAGAGWLAAGLPVTRS